jgi:hypothetical protein
VKGNERQDLPETLYFLLIQVFIGQQWVDFKQARSDRRVIAEPVVSQFQEVFDQFCGMRRRNAVELRK